MLEMLSAFGFSTIFWGVFKGAVIGLAAGTVLVLTCRKLGLFRRSGKVHQWLVRLFYPYLPLVCAGILSAWMFVAAVQSEVRVMAEQARPLVTNYSIELANTALKKILNDETPNGISLADLKNQLRQTVDETIGKYIAKAPAGLGALLEPVRVPIADSISDSLGRHLFKQAGQSMNITLSDADVARLWDKGIIEHLRDGLAMDIIHAQIDQRFKSFYNLVRLYGLLLLLPLPLEIIISKLVLPRRVKKAA